MAGNKEAFFEYMHSHEFRYFGFDDIQLRTERISALHAQDVNITGQVSTHYALRNPILGAAMNSVCEDKMAIAMGKVGGGAFIHHANTPEEQMELVKNVHSYLNGIINEPVLAREDDTVADVLGGLEKKEKRFRTLPVVDNDGRCVGLMDDTCFELFDSQTFVKDAMRPLGSFTIAESGITPQQAYEIMRNERLAVLPLLDTNRRVGGLCLVKDVMRMVRSSPSEYSLDSNGRLITFASVPTIPEEAVERVKLMQDYLDVVGIDTSHGDHHDALDTLKALREATSDVDILAGNISTEQTAIEVARLEPDGVVVGQGPGQICVSSDRLGFGTPQASAVYEVAKGARSINPEMPIIADGGIKDSADTVKAFALGATAVKVGGLIAGSDETPVPVKKDEHGAPFKEYWGMGSERAQRAFAAARARYGYYGPLRSLIFIEGFEKRVPLKGPVAHVIEEHVLGVKISMAAQGAENIQDLTEHASFMRGSNKKN